MEKLSDIKKKNFFTGSVFQFYVTEIKKYAFCKYFNFTHISKPHGLLVKVFDKFTETEINSINELQGCDWLFGTRSINSWPDLRRNTTWKSLGILSAQTDDVIPDFKGVQTFPYIVEQESIVGPWYPVKNLRERGENCKYEQVKHLEHLILTTTLGIVRRTGMEYCRINGLNVKEIYDLEDEGIENMYYQMINTPIYNTVPKNIRGKALK